MMKNTPLLQTPRLSLRPFKEGDAPAIYRWCSSEKVTKYLFWLPHRDPGVSERLLKVWLRKRRNYSWGLEENGDLFGEIEVIKDLPSGGFEIGYISREDKWNQGYMSEALIAVLAFLFGKGGYSYCYAETDKGNLASRALLEKRGFQVQKEEGRFIGKTGKNIIVIEYLLKK